MSWNPSIGGIIRNIIARNMTRTTRGMTRSDLAPVADQ